MEVIETQSGYNTDKYREIRQNMLDNKKITACTYCYEAEEKKEISERQKSLRDMKQHSDLLLSQIKDHEAGFDIKPYWYDLRLSNNCNLRCKMCSPDNSSSIAKSLGIDKPHLLHEPEIDVNPAAIRLYLSGGEPFMIKRFTDIIEKIENKNCEIIVNTNGTVVNKKMLDTLTKFQNVCITVSLDGYDDINAKIRLDSDWASIDKNIDVWKEKGWSIHAQTVVQNDNINHLIPLANYLEKKSISHWTCQEVLGDESLHWQSNSSIKKYQILPLLDLPLVKKNMQLSALLKRILTYAVA